MDLGIGLPTANTPLTAPTAIVRLAREAERLGYAAVWTFERLRPLDLDQVFFATGYAPSLDEQVRLLERLQRAVQTSSG
jgi:alkanesulfonate monooxygenase SsuD/methylene tetrahydromethanopterin reductase-like flavin-dependent oxidoreductase (luciferase family)